MIRQRPIILLAFVCSLLTARLAEANGFSAMMGRTVIHLYFLNLIIGAAEGALLALILQGFFNSSLLNCVGLMVVANYFSAFTTFSAVGAIAHRWQESFLPMVTILDIPHVLRWVVWMAYLSTIVLEWPFCVALLIYSRRPEAGSSQRPPIRPTRMPTIRQTIIGLGLSVLAQSVSYPLLLLYYSHRGETIPSVEVQANLNFARNKNATVYYFSTYDGDVYRVPLIGGRSAKVYDVKENYPGTLVLDVPEKRRLNHRSEPEAARRTFSASPSTQAVWDLWLYLVGPSDHKRLIVPHVANSATSLVGASQGFAEEELGGMTDGTPGYLDTTNSTGWSIRKGDGDTLHAENRRTGKRLAIEFDLPLSMVWRMVGQPILLPGDQVLYQLSNQIVLLDLATHKMGLVAIGKSPVVVIPK